MYVSLSKYLLISLSTYASNSQTEFWHARIDINI